MGKIQGTGTPERSSGGAEDVLVVRDGEKVA